MRKIDGSACLKIPLSLGLWVFLSALPVYGQNRPALREDFWVCPTVESNMYSISNIAFGGGAALGYGDGAALGLKVIYCTDMDKLRTLELNLLVRFYLPQLTGHEGLFIQFSGGPVLFAPDNTTIAFPSEIGTISAGLSVGWRFLFGHYFFLEPAIGGGYPYAAALGVSAGTRF